MLRYTDIGFEFIVFNKSILMSDKEMQIWMIRLKWHLIQTIDYNINNGVIEWLSDEPQPTQAELETAWIEVNKIQQKEKIVADFENKIATFDKQNWYSQTDIQAFPFKKMWADEIIKGNTSDNITRIAWSKLISAIDYANIIITKFNERETFYTDTEIERDSLLNNL